MITRAVRLGWRSCCAHCSFACSPAVASPHTLTALHSTHWRSACRCCSEPPTAWQEEGAAGQNLEGALAQADGASTGGNGRQLLTATGSLRSTAPRDQRRVALFIMFQLPGRAGRGTRARRGCGCCRRAHCGPCTSIGKNCLLRTFNRR